MDDARDVEKLFTFDTVVMRGIPDSLKTGALRQDDLGEVNIGKAREHHQFYMKTMRDKLKLHVELLEPDESLPDCPFVEDCAVVVDGTALITCPGDPSRRPEVRCELSS
ncbi:N(G),N(G)-dimethylarginine dimethylaminohydrolase 1 [Holothuria leucospilota]|uniref:N(G),N(G)-dimethylarginine dimethylaminohydrolase 1 n=1 Tax=Holothuria leucospilota TaxID=206669 RepID=A0A9Q1C6J9_HOLLE|nr:N(G),N(G)-dimethylarginine dimethylaminohydrolase 1 [Holothuria leucospilota]